MRFLKSSVMVSSSTTLSCVNCMQRDSCGLKGLLMGQWRPLTVQQGHSTCTTAARARWIVFT